MSDKKKPLSPEERAVCANLNRIWKSKKKELGLSQQKAADILGVTQGAVSHQLAGRNAVHTDAVITWAEILQCEPSEIDPNRKLYPHQWPTEEDREIYETLRALSQEKKKQGLDYLNFLKSQDLGAS